MTSTSFEMLHEGVQRWIWQQNWTGLRDVQERAVPLLLHGQGDLIVSASTAGGKTEAAFLPIASVLAEEAEDGGGPGVGFRAIYVSPLKALINDQFRRLDGLFADLDVPVTRWHGDVSQAVKTRSRKSPAGVLLITPESLEAILCRRGGEATRMFGNLGFVVIDELHAFLGNERGAQLRSLLERIDRLAIGAPAVRVGLSATLADMRVAAAALRPRDPEAVTILRSADAPNGVALSFRGFEDDGEGSGEAAVARYFHTTLREVKSLLFAGSRRNVEALTVALEEAEHTLGGQCAFLAHHGNLSRELREDAERRMREPGVPACVVCTTTLELGIDVGEVAVVGQVGPGHSVSGMRQRLGRSGRRDGAPSVMRACLREAMPSAHSHPMDMLRATTVRGIAMATLMLEGWNEPAAPRRMDLSTMVQQVLALIAQHGGASPGRVWGTLGGGVTFPNVSMADFKALLVEMGRTQLIEQTQDGLLLPGSEGERVLGSHEFFAAFMTPTEYRVQEQGGKTVGTIPLEGPLVTDGLLLLGGRRWRIVDVEPDRKLVTVTPSRGGAPPVFGGGMPLVARGVVERMRELYLGDEEPAFLDGTAARFLREGRGAFRLMGLDGRAMLPSGDTTIIFPWTGGRELLTLRLCLSARGIRAEEDAIVLSCEAQPDELRDALRDVAESDVQSGESLAAMVPDLLRAKYDRFLGEDLLRRDWAAEFVEADAMPGLAAAILDAG